MRRASVAHRIDRLVDRGHGTDRERTIHELAAAYGLHPAEVRTELDAIEEHARWFGPCTLEQVAQRCAEAFGLPEDELWAEVARITSRAGEDG